jgi:hypothetical protein
MQFSDNIDVENAGVVFSWIFGITLILSLAGIPVSHYNYNLRIAKFEARKETVYLQRIEDLDYERAYERNTLTNTIVEDNGWLATQKANKQLLWFNWYIPKKILDVEPIK